MHILFNQQTPNVDLSALTKLLEVKATEPVAVAANLRFENLSGAGSSFVNRLTLDGHIILPDSQTTVDNGIVSFVLQSRTITMREGQTLKFFAQAGGGNTAVLATITLFDVTPLGSDEVASELTPAIVNALADLDIIVRPTTKILGPCKQRVVQVPNVL